MSSHHEQAHQTIVDAACGKLDQAGQSPAVLDLVRRCLSFEPAARPDARAFLAEARRLRTSEAPTPSLLEWVDEAFPRLEQGSAHLEPEEISGKVLYEERNPTNPTIATDGSSRFELGALLAPGPMDPGRTTEPQPRPLERQAIPWAPIMAAAGLAILAGVAIAVIRPSSDQGAVAISHECQTVPMDADREAIREVDRLFRGWQDLELSMVAAAVAPDFQRHDSVSGTVTDRKAYLAQRRAIFDRLSAVTWNGPVHDRDGYGIPTVVDGVGVRCAGSDHLRVVVRYDWTVSSKRTGRHTVEEDVVDAYELRGDGLIVANLDYADLDAARAWRDECCKQKGSLEPTSRVTRRVTVQPRRITGNRPSFRGVAGRPNLEPSARRPRNDVRPSVSDPSGPNKRERNPMGLFSFVKDAGRKIGAWFGGKDSDAAKQAKADADAADAASKTAADIKAAILSYVDIDELAVAFASETATLSGRASTQSDAEKAVLVAGNTEGVAQVDDRLSVLTPAPEAAHHTVASGDTLSLIAQRYYGVMRMFDTIFEANQPMLKHPDEIYPGQVLRIPPAHPPVHTVARGETLGSIADHWYGDAKRYQDIFDANRSTLSSPDVIEVGQQLTIPMINPQVPPLA